MSEYGYGKKVPIGNLQEIRDAAFAAIGLADFVGEYSGYNDYLKDPKEYNAKKAAHEKKYGGIENRVNAKAKDVLTGIYNRGLKPPYSEKVLGELRKDLENATSEEGKYAIQTAIAVLTLENKLAERAAQGQKSWTMFEDNGHAVIYFLNASKDPSVSTWFENEVRKGKAKKAEVAEVAENNGKSDDSQQSSSEQKKIASIIGGNENPWLLANLVSKPGSVPNEIKEFIGKNPSVADEIANLSRALGGNGEGSSSRAVFELPNPSRGGFSPT